jgi:hypothetical protein
MKVLPQGMLFYILHKIALLAEAEVVEDECCCYIKAYYWDNFELGIGTGVNT